MKGLLSILTASLFFVGVLSAEQPEIWFRVDYVSNGRPLGTLSFRMEGERFVDLSFIGVSGDHKREVFAARFHGDEITEISYGVVQDSGLDEMGKWHDESFDVWRTVWTGAKTELIEPVKHERDTLNLDRSQAVAAVAGFRTYAIAHRSEAKSIPWTTVEEILERKTEVQPGATDNPDDAQRLREDY